LRPYIHHIYPFTYTDAHNHTSYSYTPTYALKKEKEEEERTKKKASTQRIATQRHSAPQFILMIKQKNKM
jgi:hypothetical protein